MSGTQVQKVSLTVCPDAAADELPAAVGAAAVVPDAGGVELPDEEQPAAESTASAALASAVPINTGPAFPVARLRRRWGIDFMVPPR
jgi:hypothetical protein